MSTAASYQGNWERRWHPLLAEWVVVAAATGNRPWNGALVSGDETSISSYDPTCYLCSGNTRSNGAVNANYRGPWAFDNDYASFAANAPVFDKEDTSPLRRRESNQGRCRVLCWTEDHSQTLASISQDNMRAVAELWQQEYTTLSQDPDIKQILIFENKGQEIGVSNPHPHGQIYATGFVGDTFSRLRKNQSDWYAEHHSLLFTDLLKREEYQHSLKIAENEHCVAIVPYFARFAYECWIIPKHAVQHIGQLSDNALHGLADLYQGMAKTYNTLFQRESPNISLLYNAPCDDAPDNSYWQFHLVMQPPLREPDKLKYLAGYESGGGNIVNPVQAEMAAARLREAFYAQGGCQ